MISKRNAIDFVKTLTADECIELNNLIVYHKEHLIGTEQFKGPIMKKFPFRKDYHWQLAELLNTMAERNVSLSSSANMLSDIRSMSLSDVVSSGMYDEVVICIPKDCNIYNDYKIIPNSYFDVIDFVVQEFESGTFRPQDIIDCKLYDEEDVINSVKTTSAEDVCSILLSDEINFKAALNIFNEILISVYGSAEATLYYPESEYDSMIDALKADGSEALYNALRTAKIIDTSKPYFRCESGGKHTEFISESEVIHSIEQDIKMFYEDRETRNKCIKVMEKHFPYEMSHADNKILF